MENYQIQIDRIKTKFDLAKRIDYKFQVFGASSHEYKIGPPASEKEIRNIEERYYITLPRCYKAFISKFGNGGQILKGYLNSGSAPGPYYGIYSLGNNLDELIDLPHHYLSKNPSIYPKMSDQEWAKLIAKAFEEDISDEDYENEIRKIFSGILPLGSQGCSYIHGLVLNGENAGKVVNLDISLNKPKFTYEKNFLDWYERWLDEIILGKIPKNGSEWFGYSKRKHPSLNLEEATKIAALNSKRAAKYVKNKKKENLGSIPEAKRQKKWFQFWR